MAVLAECIDLVSVLWSAEAVQMFPNRRRNGRVSPIGFDDTRHGPIDTNLSCDLARR
jgi:hypothetical protein